MATQAYLEERGCLRKRPYQRRQVALAAMNILKKTKPPEEKFKVYKCRFCGCWHIEHQRDSPRPTRAPFGCKKL